MKTTKLLSIICVIIFIFSACQKNTSELTNLIPSEASTVVYIDTKSLIEKSNYNVFENAQVKKGLEEVKRSLSDNKDAQKLLEHFVEKDINVLGIDLKGDAFLYQLEDVQGLIFKVNSSSRVEKVLTSALESTKESIKKVDNINILMWPSGNAFVAWDDNRLLVLFSLESYRWADMEEVGALDKQVVGFFKQTSKESITSQPGFAEFIANKKDISIYNSFKGTRFEEYASEFSGVSEYINQIKSITNISFEKGQIAIVPEIFFVNDTVKAKFEAIANDISKPINGEAFKFMQKDPMFVICGGLNGEGLYNIIQKSEAFSAREKSEFSTVLPQINGDVLCYVSNIEVIKTIITDGYGSEYDDVAEKISSGFLVETNNPQKNQEFLDRVIMDIKDYTKIVDVSKNIYQTTDYSGNVTYFGQKDNYLFATLNHNPFTGVKNETSISVPANSIFIMKISNRDISNLIEASRFFYNEKEALVKKGADLLEDCEFSVDKSFKAYGRISFRDKDKNSLETICLHLDKLIDSPELLMSFF